MFAIDGSGSITPAEFEAQKSFVLNVVTVISVDDAVELAGVQYGIASSPISPLTTHIEDFILAVNDEPQLFAPHTSLVAGVNYCFRELIRRPNEANKMVILGDGISFIGDSAATERADRFREVTGGKICAVGTGFEDPIELLGIAGGNPDQLFLADSFLDMLELRKILPPLIAEICNADLQR